MATVDISQVVGNAPPPMYVAISSVFAQNVVPPGATVDISAIWTINPPPPTAKVQISAVIALSFSRAAVDVSNVQMMQTPATTVQISEVDFLQIPPPQLVGVLWKEFVSGQFVDPVHWTPMIRIGGTFVPL